MQYLHHWQLMLEVKRMLCDLRPDVEDWRKQPDEKGQIDVRNHEVKVIQPDIYNIFKYCYYDDVLGPMLVCLPDYHPLMVKKSIYNSIEAICKDSEIETSLHDLCFLINYMLWHLEYLQLNNSKAAIINEREFHKFIDKVEKAIEKYEDCPPDEVFAVVKEIDKLYDVCQMAIKKDFKYCLPHEAIKGKYELLKEHMINHFIIMRSHGVTSKPKFAFIGNRYKHTKLRLISLFLDYFMDNVVPNENTQSEKYRIAGLILDFNNIIDDNEFDSEMDDYLRSRHKAGKELPDFRLFG